MEIFIGLSLFLGRKTSTYLTALRNKSGRTGPDYDDFMYSLPDGYDPARYASEVKKIVDSCEEFGVSIIPFPDERYPELLRSIYDPPLVLYVKGCLKFGRLSIAIVGARKCSSYGRNTAFELGAGLAERGCSVISGMAFGIDASAHLGALEKGGHTVAVLGCGVEKAYPARNQFIYDRILEQSGAVMSEFVPGTEPLKHHFPLRNRIISGVSSGVAVVEAALKSGSLITARNALEEGREVFCVPGPVTSSLSEGTNRLIKLSGAKLICSVDDIFEEFNLTGEGYFDRLQNTNSREDSRILASIPYLEDAAVSIDQLVIELDMSVRELTLKILEYENDGLICRTCGNKLYRLK